MPLRSYKDIAMDELIWDKAFSSKLGELSVDSLEEFYKNVISHNPEPDTNVNYLKNLFKLSQELLKFKGEQVNTLADHLDKYLSREYEGKSLETLEELQNSLAESGKQSSESGYVDVDELKEDLLRSEHQNEKLLTELKAREEELHVAKRETEKGDELWLVSQNLSKKIQAYLNEKQALQASTMMLSEQVAMQLEIQKEMVVLQKSKNGEALSPQKSPQMSEKYQELADNIHKKNKHISQLLNDIELMERDNLLLREKVVSLREKLEESTKHINEIFGELSGLKHSNEIENEKMHYLENQNEALRSQIKELVKQNRDRENELVEFSGKLEHHVKEWMNVLQEKNSHIHNLKSQIDELNVQLCDIQTRSEKETEQSLHEILIKREQQIEVLKNELVTAVTDINFCMETIEEMSDKRSNDKLMTEVQPVELLNLRMELKNMNEKLKIMENKLKDAEENARIKAQELSDVIIQLRQYESGEYGLTDAVREIKELRKQKNNSEKHLEELVDALNSLRLKCSYMEEENVKLRIKHDLPPESTPDTSILDAEKEGQLSDAFKLQIALLEEENVKLKLKNHELGKRIKSLTEQMQEFAVKNNPDAETDDQILATSIEENKEKDGNHTEDSINEADVQILHLKKQVTDITKENEALRKGMHEILDSIHNQDGSSAVQIESRSLERLLEALDSRHISGWYHPAMRLQAQLHAVEGSNSTLREELRIVRKEEQECREQLQKSLLKIEQFKELARSKQQGRKHSTFSELTLPSEMERVATPNEVARLKLQLIHVLCEYNKQEEKCSNLTVKLENLNDKLRTISLEMRTLYQKYKVREEHWQNLQKENEIKSEALNNQLKNLQEKLAHYKDFWDCLSQSDNEKMEIVSRQIKQISESMNVILERDTKCETLQNLLMEKSQENTKLKRDQEDMEFLSRKSIAKLKKEKEEILLQIRSLQHMLEDSVPVATLEELNAVFSELKCKYRDLLLSEQNVTYEGHVAAYLEGKIQVLTRQNEELKVGLLEAKETVLTLQTFLSAFNSNTAIEERFKNEIASLSKKMAITEIKELDEKHRAEHAVKMHDIWKAQCDWLTSRKTELETQNDALMKQNLKLQSTERTLMEKIITFVPYSDVEEMKMMLNNYEIENEKLILDNSALKESLGIAQDQIFNLQSWRECQSFEVNVMRQQILNMLNSMDKVAVAKVTNELVFVRLSQNEMLKTVQKLKNENLRLKTAVISDELHLEKRLHSINYLKHQIKNRTRVMYQAVQDLRCQYSGPMSLATQEQLALNLKNIWKERHEAIEMLQKAQKSVDKWLQSEVTSETNIASIEEIKSILKSFGAQKDVQTQIMAWHNKNIQQRLQEIKIKQELELKSSELEHAEQYVKRQNEQIEKLEQCHINLIKAWEQSQRAWDQIQEHFCKQLDTYEESVDDSYFSANTEKACLLRDLKETMAVLNESLQMHEKIMTVIKEKLYALNQQLIEKDNIITELQQKISQLINNTREKETKDNESVMNMIHSLNKLLKQKDDTISLYLHMMEENRKGNTLQKSLLESEIVKLKALYINQHQISVDELSKFLIKPTDATTRTSRDPTATSNNSLSTG